MSDDWRTKNEGLCPVCKKTATQMCTGCSTVYYCSQEHQKSDRKVHKKNCRPVKLVVDQTIGRRYIAKREIKVDEIIFREIKPLLAYPSFLSDNPTPTCLNCYVPLKSVDETKQCERCGWYICLSCTKHGPECELMLKYRKSKLTEEENKALWEPSNKNHATMMLYLYTMLIIVMRALALQENDAIAYEKLLKLEHHSDCWAKYKPLPPLVGYKEVAKFIEKFLNIKDLDEAKILKILGVTLINGFEFGPNNHGVVFDKTSYIEHSCRPNSFADIQNDRAIVRVVVPIPKGDPITICYGWFGSNTAERRRKLSRSKIFDCHCERCKDPTEFGTMFNSVKCTNSKCTGYMLPPTFLVSSGEEIPNYVCDQCNLEIPSTDVDLLTNNISEKYSKVNNKSVIELKRFIADHAKFLHENHFTMFLPRLALIHAVDCKIASVEVLKESVKLCRKMIHLLETLMPGLFLERGMILYKLYLCIDALIRLEPPCEIELLRQFKECADLLVKAKQLLYYKETFVKELVDTEIERMQKTEVHMVEKLTFMSL